MEGPESRDVFNNQAMENLFINSQTMFFINTQRIKEINSILLPLTDAYVNYIQNQASKDIEQLPIDIQQQFSSLMNAIFGDKTNDTSITTAREKSDTLHAKLIHALSVSYQLPKFIREMSFIYLVAKFEDFISKEFQIVFTRKPEELKSKRKDKKITYEEIFSASKLEELWDKIIEQEITTTMWGLEGINNGLKYFLCIDLSDNNDNWKAIKECFQRRNILVHNNGKVNTTYRQKTGKNPIEEYLSVDEHYLSKSIILFETYCNEITDRLLQGFAKKKT
jgi:hypothetical protein